MKRPTQCNEEHLEYLKVLSKEMLRSKAYPEINGYWEKELRRAEGQKTLDSFNRR